jgi:hypothetical protein
MSLQPGIQGKQGREPVTLRQEAFPGQITQALWVAPSEGQTGTADPAPRRGYPPGDANVQAPRAAAW